MSCVPKLKNCASAPLADQPDGLVGKGNKWTCGDCYEGYFWNDEESICDKCEIDHCVDCVSETECLTCSAGYMP